MDIGHGKPRSQADSKAGTQERQLQGRGEPKEEKRK